ncbi:hypothetical protein [Lentilactobacillus kosonis]|nr:hypothetical protein [Lentilactobacillus kosonis]
MQYLSIAITVFLIIELIANFFMPIFPPLFLGIWLLILYVLYLAERIDDLIVTHKINKLREVAEKEIEELVRAYGEKIGDEEKHDRS